MSQMLNQAKIIICAGSGGVGKTTVASALGTVFASSGKRVLVLTIDPSKRLATALGLDPDSDEEVAVPNQKFNGQLYASLIQPQKTFEKFIRSSPAANSERVQRLMNNRLYKQLSTTLSGSQEFTSLQRLHAAVNSQKYDLIILDTPPAQHAIDFLRAPEKIYALFQESITKWFRTPQQRGLIQNLIFQGTQKVMKALERVTGSAFIEELADFFASIEGLQSTIQSRSIEMHRLLSSAETQFVLVSSFDLGKLKELVQFSKTLNQGGYSVSTIIVNRAMPQGVSWDEGEADRSDELISRLLEYQRHMQAYYEERMGMLKRFRHDLSPSVQLVQLPEFYDEISGLEGLTKVGQVIMKEMEKIE